MITNLPSVLKKRIARYLTGREAIAMSQTCRTMHQDLSLSVISPFVTVIKDEFRCRGGYLDGDTPRRGPPIPMIFPSPLTTIHSMVFTTTWSDQGWGNQKGQLFIVAFQQPTNNNNNNQNNNNDINNNKDNNDTRINGGRIIWQSNIAEHDPQKLTISFPPPRHVDENYYFYYKVGGGGGHELMFQDMKLHVVIFDTIRPNLSKQVVQAIQNNGLFYIDEIISRNKYDTTMELSDLRRNEFAFKMLQTVVKSIINQIQTNNNGGNNDNQQQQQQPDELLVSFLQERGFDALDLGYLQTLHDLILGIDHHAKSIAHADSMSNNYDNNDNGLDDSDYTASEVSTGEDYDDNDDGGSESEGSGDDMED